MSATSESPELESLAYDPERQTHTARFDRAATAASMAVAAALSDVMNVDPTELKPLGSAIDTDALDALIDQSGMGDGDASVTFTLGRHELMVSTDGIVTVTEHTHAAGIHR